MTSAQLSSAVSTAVAAKTLNIARQEGAGLVAMINNSAVKPGDPLVAKATGLGRNLDVYG